MSEWGKPGQSTKRCAGPDFGSVRWYFCLDTEHPILQATTPVSKIANPDSWDMERCVFGVGFWRTSLQPLDRDADHTRPRRHQVRKGRLNEKKILAENEAQNCLRCSRSDCSSKLLKVTLNSQGQRVKTAANQHLWDPSSGLFRDNETTTLYPQDGNVWAVKSNLTQSLSQIRQISQSLRNRWVGLSFKFTSLPGTPTPRWTSSRLEWGFMMNDPRMTNSTFIEGYSTDGSLHYEPYANDPRVSHSHGWSTGPTSVLMNYAAGLKLTSGAGATWSISPQPGNLTSIDAGFSTKLGAFAITFEMRNGTYQGLRFSTPIGTTGCVVLPGANALVGVNGTRVVLGADGLAGGLDGGNWTLFSEVHPSGRTGRKNW
ncbi:hypothetical protein N7509_000450 [Penicillium cosmopolitanum]|uniref:Alpha-L-rhamnosidase C-terminal domain-containing protein n=1 Tax=Penicillium cosmopolitanum TaxID=1131564 RepID=A0A9X0BE87_9EURO|nr:uncharacterized protein N7509_000450 [Penicillium cosmopolitanum]KAJ5413823.1 hypothetical protein N7509_000450 [Penicillium cosmopolitanum]